MKTKHYLISAALLTAITAAIAATHIYKGQDSARENNGTSISQETAQTETFTKNVHNAEKATQGYHGRQGRRISQRRQQQQLLPLWRPPTRQTMPRAS